MKETELRELIKEMVINEGGAFSDDPVEDVMWQNKAMHNDVKLIIKTTEKFITKLTTFNASSKGQQMQGAISKKALKKFLNSMVNRTVDKSGLK